MNYVFHDEDLSLIEKICRINGIREDDLDVSVFDHHEEPDVLRAFKEKLLSYADKRFFIVGDYDCDGICATTIMKKLFDDVVGGVLGLVDDEASAGSAKWEKALDAAMDIVLEARAKVRAEKNWAESDRIRDVLASAGISVKDTKEGPTWSIN